MSLEVRVVEEGFANVQGWWDELLDASHRPSPFASTSWLASWWEIYGGDFEPLILAFTLAGRLVGGCAFYRRRRRWRGVLPVTELRLVGDRHVGSEGLDLIVRRGLEREAARALAAFLKDNAWGQDVVHLAGLRPGAVLLRDEALPGVVAAGALQLNRSPFLRLPPEGRVRPRSKSFAERVARKSRGLIDRRRLRFSRCETLGEVERALSALFALHQRRWLARGEKGSFADPRKRAFYRRVAPLLLAEGRLELFALWEDGRALAVLFGAGGGGCLYYLQSGFDEALASYGPGNVLLYQILQDAVRRGFERFDFMKGTEPYKTLWTGEDEPLFLRRHFAPGWRGSIARAGAGLKQRLTCPGWVEGLR